MVGGASAPGHVRKHAEGIGTVGAKQRWGRWLRIGSAVALSLTAAACGTRLPDAAFVSTGNGSGGTGTGAQSTASGAGGPSAGGVGSAGALPGGALANTPGASSAGGATGPTGGPTAGAAANSAPVGGAAPAGGNGGATAVGVTAGAIEVGNIATDSGPLPGATAGAQRGAAAYFAYVNSQGGVYGRQLHLVQGDDALDPGTARSEFLRIEPQVFAFAGSFAVADSGYVDLLKSTAIPYIGATIDPGGRQIPTVITPQTPRAPLPTNVIYSGPELYLHQQFPKANKLAFLYTNVGGVASNIAGTIAAWKSVGVQVVDTAGVDPTATDYTPEVVQARADGATAVMCFAFEVNMIARFIQDMKQQGWQPGLSVSVLSYDSDYYKLLGSNGDGWHESEATIPYQDPAEAAKSPELALYREWIARLYPNDKLDLFTVDGWADAEFFVDALKKAGPHLTWPSLLSAARSITGFDANGMLSPVLPTPNCFTMLMSQGGRWVRETPSQVGGGYTCMGQKITF